jgi:hypothetical protein
MTGADIEAEVQTVSVSFFQSNAALAHPNTGQLFTESLKDVMMNQTRLQLVADKGDIRYEGFITGYDVRPIAISGNETATLNRLTISVQVKYTNTKNEKKNFENTFTRFADFESTEQLSSIEENLIRQINDQLVQDIFDKSLSNW